MSKEIPDLFGKLSLRHWYKYLLYLSGVLLILTVVIGSKVELSRVISFSLWTIGLSLFLWILDDIFQIGLNYYSQESEDAVKAILVVRYIVYIVLFIIWVGVAVGSFF
jgi:hypothetical protein